MNKNKSTSKSTTSTAKVSKKGPGRPQYQIKWPTGKFTFTDLEIENGVNPDTGKGKDCTTLTLRKGLKRDQGKRGYSLIVLLKGVLAEPNNKKGLGRKQLVYARRTVADKFVAKPAKPATKEVKTPAPRKAKKVSAPKSDVTVDVATPQPEPVEAVNEVSQDTVDYEAQKAALLEPTPAVIITPDAEVTDNPDEVAEAIASNDAETVTIGN